MAILGACWQPRERRKGDISAALSRILPEKGSRRRISLKNHIFAGTYPRIVKIVPMSGVPKSATENDFDKEKGGIAAALHKLEPVGWT